MSRKIFQLGFHTMLAVWAAAQSSDFERAQQLAAGGRLDEAIAVFRSLLARQPRDPRLLSAAAVVEYKAGRYRDAAGHAGEALRIEPESFVASLFLGASLLKLGEPRNAIPHLSKAAAAQPGDRNARLMLAEALLADQRFAEAAEQFEASARLLPDSPRVWYGLFAASSALSGGTARSRAAEARSRLEQFPESPERRAAAAIEHERRGRHREAAAEWRAALAASPAEPAFLRKLVLALYAANDFRDGLKALSEALERDPESAEWNFLYGAGLMNMQQTERAIEYLRKAVAIDPELLPARAAIGQAYLQSGKPLEAIPHLEASLADDEDGSRHYQLARALQAAGRRDEAAAAIRKYQELRATSPARRP